MDDIKLTSINREEIKKYLGYGKVDTDDSKVEAYIDKAEKTVLETAIPRYVYKAFEIEKNIDGILFKGTNLCMSGNSIMEHLEGMNRAVLFAGTISSDIDRAITNAGKEDILMSLILDAASSAAVEQLGNKFDEMLQNRLKGFYITFRFGIGYGDLSLSFQKPVLDILEASKRIGITITEDNIMIPRKSITGVIGISENPIPKKKMGCALCNMKDKCRFRREGSRCNE